MSSSQQEFLFFDTIAHDGEIEQVLQVDEIKFEQPVYIDEIRVLPTGYNVNGLEKSVIRIGATKPMPCELEFFGKNLNARSNRDRVRYRRLGKKVFRDENDMVFYPSLSIPTDSMIIRGKYDALTVAVVGVLARPKSPPPRHDPQGNNKQIVDFLQSALPPHRAHPMDTLPLAIPPPNAPSAGFAIQQHPHPSSVTDNVSSSSAAHSDGVWVAPPEQPSRQQTQVTASFSHLQPQRPTPGFVGPPPPRLNDEHLHDYSHPSSQQTYSSNRLDDQQQQASSIRSQPAPTFSSRPQTRTGYSSSDYPHGDKSLDDMDEKFTRVSATIPQYRPNIADHMHDDLNQISIPSGASIIAPPFSHFPHQNQHSSSNIKKDDDHLFLHPSCMGDNHRRIQDTYILSSNNGSNFQQQISSDGDSYMSDDNTSESEASSIHGLLFNEDEQQAFKRDALYNTRGSTRLTALKIFHSTTKTPYEIECEKAHHEKYRYANEELILHFRKLLSHASIDHCDIAFLESLESICTVLPIALACLDSNEELVLAIERLTDWADKLINIEYIMQKQFTELKDTLLKIRIIKCGVRLCGHLSVLTEDMSNDWIKNDYQSKLLDLYDDEYIAPSVKLLIIKILDQGLFFKSGLLWFTGQHPDFPLTTRESPYFRLLQKLQAGNELKQLTALINCLIRKIHLNEEFVSFQSEIKTLSSDESPSLTIERKNTFDNLLISLSTIRDVLINSTDLISQEKSSHIASFQSILPVVYSKIPNKENSWPSILRLMIDSDFLKSITVLIHLCVLNQRQDIFNLIEDILREFLNSFDCLIYLSNQTSTQHALLKALYFAELKFDGINNDPVGPQLVCAFQILSYIDELKFLSLKDQLEIDNNDLLQILHCILSLILFHHYIRKLSNKRRIIVRVFSMETNFLSLLHFIEFSGGDNEILKNSIQTRYVARIIYELFATPDSILLVEQYGLRVLDLCEKHSNQRLIRLRTWFLPLLKIKSFDYTQETAENLLNELKTQLNESTNSGEFSPGLVTILRLIQYLSIPPENQFVLGAKIELKYDFMLLKFYSQGIYSLLISILEKCADSLLRTWQIGVPMSIPDRIVIYGILMSALIIFKTLLQKLTLDRKTKFVDITPIHALFSVYTVTLCASPSTELADVDIIRTNLIDSFLAYTWSNQSDNEQINVQNCAWTLVLKEILRLITLFPYSITSGLCLITELLPIPLPHTVRQPLTDNETNAIKDDFHRYHTVVHYIWTHDNNHQLRKLIQSLSHTSNSIMQEILRRICMQLIDLGAKLAKLVMKTLMDELISAWKIDHSEIVKTPKQSISDSGRLVAFIASLVAVRSGKCALLSLLNSSDEKYSMIIKDMLEYLHTRAESNDTCLCQEATMSIIQTLCDANLCLSSSKSSDNSLQILANALPNEELLSYILTNILRLLSSTKQQQTWTQTTMGLRTMISLAEHDFGLQMIRISLIQNKEIFCTLIAEFDLRFDKEQPDYLEAVSALMIFLQRLMIIETIPDSSFIRTQCLPPSFFRELLGVSSENESQLEKFIDLINAVVNDDSSGSHENETKQQTNVNPDGIEPNEEDQQCLQTLQKILERANSIIQSLKANDREQEMFANNVINLPKSEVIDIQFQNRLIYILVNEYTDDQRSSELYWLGIPAPLLDDVDYVQDETTQNPDETNEKVKCDLEDFIGKYCGTFNFFEEYKKEIIDRITKKRKSSPKKRTVTVEPPSNVDTSIITTSVSRGRTPWSAPMRGNNRRNVRPGSVNTNIPPPAGIQRRIDHFRNRPLNTSRPPSMHVDEFEKQFNDNPNGNNGANSSSNNNNNNNINENNNGGNNGNDNELLSNIQSANDGGSDRDRWSRRGSTPNFRPSSSSSHRYPFSSNNLSYPGVGFSLRDRLPYGYPSSRYTTFEMDFPPPYFPGEELPDDRPYDYYPINMPFDHMRSRNHFGRYDPSGFH